MRAFFLLLVVTLAGCQCGTNLGLADAGTPDAGPPVIECTLSFGEPGSECPQDIPECSFGICKRPCVANDGCNDLSTFCNGASGYCEFGCRDSSVCGAGTACSSGQCIEAQGCITKCDCDVGKVCVGGACSDPPSNCLSNNDCGRGALVNAQGVDDCEDIVCPGFQPATCFDPDPDPCGDDADCAGRPGCAGGCTCTGNQACVPEVACTEANESTQCGNGNYCDGNGSCQVLPACAGEGQCSGLGLTCNTAAGTCERANPCTTSTECTTAPATYCNTATGFCAQALCTNGGVTCVGTEQCTADGRCVPQGPGEPCTVNANCDAAEYCAVVNGTGACTVGCRDNASCAPQACNSNHVCVGDAEDLAGYDEACTDSGDCQAGLVCGGFTDRCAEECAPSGSSCAAGACCALSGENCCNPFGFCSGIGC